MARKTVGPTLGRVIAGKYVIDFQGWTQAELKILRRICEISEPERQTPAYSFSECYYFSGGRWWAGGTHNMVGKDVIRVGDIEMPEWVKDRSK